MFVWLMAAGAATLSVSDLVAGAEVSVEVDGVPAGASVTVAGSLAGEGAGPCPAELGGDCLSLLAPVRILARGTADGSGRVELVAQLADGAPLGPVSLQAAWSGSSSGTTPVVSAEVVAPRRVVLLGDSITEGQLSGVGGTPYGELVRDGLGDTWDVHGIGCGGASSLDWTLPFGNAICGGQLWSPTVYEARALPLLPADVVTVMLGTNDATGFFEPSPTDPVDYRQAMDAIVANLLADGAGTVMLLPPPPQCPGASMDLVMQYRDEVLDLCTTTAGVVCGPDVTTLLGPADFDGCDVHPDASGHEAIADALVDALQAL